MDYEILEVGNPMLARNAERVADFAADSLNHYIDAMHSLMKQRGGVGIAAPQIGIGLQIVIVASRPNPRYPSAPMMEPMVLINPKITGLSDRKVVDWEGCLSVPGLRGRVSRSDEVTVRYQLQCAEFQQVTFEGFPARIFLHEYDHLVGKTLLDRVASPADLYSEKEYLKRLQAE